MNIIGYSRLRHNRLISRSLFPCTFHILEHFHVYYLFFSFKSDDEETDRSERERRLLKKLQAVNDKLDSCEREKDKVCTCAGIIFELFSCKFQVACKMSSLKIIL